MATVADLLATAELKIHGRLVDSSNAALVVEADGHVAVYKPVMGERPLWDFPDHTLAHREVATYLLSVALGWDLVPLTVWRDEGPAGPGSCQSWIDSADTTEYVNIFEAGKVPEGWHQIIEGVDGDDKPVAVAHADAFALRQLTVFDALINNADRKVGHILSDSGALLGIDHGVTFNVEPKLRTVLWGFAGSPLEASLVSDVQKLVADFNRLSAPLVEHLGESEIEAILQRALALLEDGNFPQPMSDGPNIPWPII